MINDAVPADSGRSNGFDWKVLLYDNKGRDIIAPLLKVYELRDLRVTLPMSMKKVHTPVPNAPAIYLCEPTEENITQIAQDCSKQLYQWVYINFISQCPRHQMESLAEQLAATGALPSIRHIRVFDQTLSFVAESNDLYSLMLHKSFTTLNSRRTADVDMEHHVDNISLGLSHVLLSQHVLPLVAFARNGPAEMIGQKVSGLLGDLLRENAMGAAVNNDPSVGRPLLLVVDRNSDIAAGLHHPFTYRGLLIDALGMHLNKVEIDSVIDIDPVNDKVFAQHGGKDFGDFSERVKRELDDYTREYESLSRANAPKFDSDSKQAISEMLANAPKLRERKQSLDSHVKLAHTILKKITDGHLDKYHGVEAGLIFSEGFDMTAFAELMGSNTPLGDKQRIYLVAFIANASDEIKLAEIDKLRHFVEGEGMPFPALQYIRRLRSWSMNNPQRNGNEPQNAASIGWSLAQNLAKNITNTFTQGGKRQLTLTRLVDALLEDRAASARGGAATAARAKLIEGLGAVEPRTSRPVDLSDLRFNQVIVFVAGGGTISEYENLKLWEQEHPRKSVIYGSTDIVSGVEFLGELATLGNEN
eukprot:GILI01011764.1.p1 GENE.GILI01011764.1~~GILI01011764.1.p1  ORF type:complete len:615 (-),score=102.29 GILI01011764.1:164-1924(-)